MNDKLITDETICAISTAQGMGAIATIRVAGPDALSITDALFRSPKGKRLSEQRGGTFHFGTFGAEGDDIDEVVVSVFRAPHSFTGEDIAEITCHGSVVIQQRIIQVLISYGVRMARPGEFTQRAFANGKMDLTQAEAVADLIASQNDAARKIALRQMRGGFSNELKELRAQLIKFSSLLELELDFSEEDVEFANRLELKELLQKIDTTVMRLAQSFRLGNAIKNGIPVAIVGPTNAGKSTLLNTLLNEERAIVSDIHGTTRDTIEDTISIDGVTFRFIDTAGLRQTNDAIENIGIGRTYEKIEKASIVILMCDATTDKDLSVRQIREIAGKMDFDGQRLIVALNKSDKTGEIQLSAADLNEFKSVADIVSISAKNKVGIEALTTLLTRAADLKAADTESTIVTNARHYEALTRSHEYLQTVYRGLCENMSGEFVALDLHDAIDELGKITGEVSSQDVLNNIFAHFCIGK